MKRWPDGRRIVTASADKTARLWDVSQEIDIKDRLPRCLSQKQRADSSLPSEPPFWCIEKEKYPYHTQAWKDWLAAKRAGKNPELPKEE